MPKGGRGGRTSIVSQLQTIKRSGGFPGYVMANQAVEVFKGIDKVFDLPQNVQAAMADSKFRMWETPSKDGASMDIKFSHKGRVFGGSYPLGKTANETATIRSGAIKFVLINQNKKNPL